MKQNNNHDITIETEHKNKQLFPSRNVDCRLATWYFLFIRLNSFHCVDDDYDDDDDFVGIDIAGVMKFEGKELKKLNVA